MRGVSTWVVIALTTCLSACASTPDDLDKRPSITHPPRMTLCSNNGSMEEFERDWYCEPLRKAKEPLVPVANIGITREAYRLIWLRSFHPAVIVRVEFESSNSGRVVATSLDPPGGMKPETRISYQRTAILSAEDVQNLRDKYYSASFWSLPHEFDLEMEFGGFSSRIPVEVIQSDGARWIVEGISAGRYQVIGSSGQGPPGSLGLALLNLAHDKMPDFVIEPIY